MRITTTICLVLMSLMGHAQSGAIKKLIESLKEHEYEKVEKKITKDYQKDSLDPETLLAVSIMLDYDSFPGFNPDSSYLFILKARERFSMLEEKEKKKFISKGIDSTLLEAHKIHLDERAFQRARMQNTVESYDRFIYFHPTAKEIPEAIDFRYTAAFDVALNKDTYQSYRYFMDTYPDAPQYQQAAKRYELLFFQSKTGDGKLISIINFLKINPVTPYRNSLEKQILEISTAGNKLDDFTQFLSDYPKTIHKREVINRLFHLYKEEGIQDQFPVEWINDSLARVREANTGVVIPVVLNGEYQFLSEEGTILFDKTYPEVYPLYLCDGAYGDILFIKENDTSKLITRFNEDVFEGDFDEVEDIGYGILKVGRAGAFGALHKTGLSILAYEYDDIKIVAGSYIAFKQHGKWGLTTFFGRQVTRNIFDDITGLNRLLLFEKDERYAFATIQHMKPGADGEDVPLSFEYDDYELISEKNIWVSAGEKEGVINRDATFDIPLAKHKVIPGKLGYIVEASGIFQFLDNEFNESFSGFKNVTYNEAFILGEQEGKMYLVHKVSDEKVSYPSLKLLGSSFALAVTETNQLTIFPNNTIITSNLEVSIKLLTSAEGAEYILQIEGDKKTVYSLGGIEILSGKYTSVNALGKEYLVVDQKGKKGLYLNNGERLLKPYNDAIAGYDRGGVSILRRGKFGYYHKGDSLYINPVYESRIRLGYKDLMIAMKEDKYIFIRNEDEQVGKMGFDNITLWTDSVYIVENEGIFSFYNPFTNVETIKNLDEFEFMEDQYKGKLAKITKGKEVGLVHEEHGVIIPPEYTYITPMGPIYKAEKFISAAAYYVVVYYNRQGKIIWKQGMDADAYDLIFCDQ